MIENVVEWVSREMPWAELVRLLMASVAGAIVGWEREHQGKPAGLRTHMLVAVGAATYVLVTLELIDEMSAQSVIRLDPIRTVAGIIGGVGFLGAGSIIQSRGSVEGITTAASIWISAALGTAAGLGMYKITFSCLLFALAILLGLRLVEPRQDNTTTPDRDTDR